MFGISKDSIVHFIGIGGIGMSAIAELLLKLGYRVSGSDLSESEVIQKLRALGAEINLEHKAENIKDARLVVYSSAIDTKNPEIRQAMQNNIPIIKRAEMLSELMKLKTGVTVAGSHGKTTTTSFLATILQNLSYRPSYVIGGIVKNLGGHAHLGEGDIFIAEADESDGSFLCLNPTMSIVTNIDNDHLDYYGELDNLKNAFGEFFKKIPFNGLIALNANDKASCEIVSPLQTTCKFFGIRGKEKYCEKIDYQATNVVQVDSGTQFEILFKGESYPFLIRLSGEHNILNAMGAIVVAHHLGASFQEIATAIIGFEGVKRRLEVIAKKQDFVLIDDYAHHPTEIMATLRTLRYRYQDKKIIAIFEPHRYSRTQNFWNEFVCSFKDVDELHVLPIYAASEKIIEHVNSVTLVQSINDNMGNAYYLKTLDDMSEILKKYEDTNSVLITLGAGPISNKIRTIVNAK